MVDDREHIENDYNLLARYDITQEEAEAYLEEFSDVELDETSLQHVAGGAYNPDCNNNNAQKCYKY